MLILLLLASIQSFSQVLPEERTTNWSVAGLDHILQEPETVLDILDFGAAGDSITDNSSALNNAITALNGQAGIISFPEGTFLFTSGISLNDSVIIRGVSAEKTHLVFDLQGQAANCFNISRNQSTVFTSVVSGYEKNSTKIKVDNPGDFTEGAYAEIRQQNAEWDTHPISWAEYSVGQIVRIENINGNHLILKNPLRIDFESRLNPEVRQLDVITDAGFECLKVSRIDEPQEGAGYNFYFGYAANCRVMGVESNKSVGSHIYITRSSNLEIKGCYIHDAFTFDGSGTRGYGVTLNMHSGECLIENNIFRKLRHAMMVKTGANGNVFAYNYSIEPWRSEDLHDFTGDISLHGHYAYLNLFEGNIVQNIIIDHYWGPSGPFNTFFRNRAELYGFIITESDTTQTALQNIIGSEISGSQNLHGQYMLNGSDHFEFANNVKEIIKPEGTSNLSDTSYYLQERPYFWNISDPWPSVGIPNDLDQYINPAKQRYLNGGNLCICLDDMLTEVPAVQKTKAFIYPNPNQGILYFSSPGEVKEVYLYDVMGRLYATFDLHDNFLQVPEDIPSGMIIVKTTGKSETQISKILLCR